MFLVVANKSAALTSDLLEDIIDERVHDAHRSLADSDLRVDLLENSIDVDAEGLGSLLLGGGGFLDLLAGSGCFSRGFLGAHFLELKLGWLLK